MTAMTNRSFDRLRLGLQQKRRAKVLKVDPSHIRGHYHSNYLNADNRSNLSLTFVTSIIHHPITTEVKGKDQGQMISVLPAGSQATILPRYPILKYQSVNVGFLIMFLESLNDENSGRGMKSSFLMIIIFNYGVFGGDCIILILDIELLRSFVKIT